MVGKQDLDEQGARPDTDIRLVEKGWTVLRIWEHVPIDDAVSTIVLHVERLTMP